MLKTTNTVVEFDNKTLKCILISDHIMLKTSDSTKIVNKPFHLEFSAPSTFKPGLSYSGAVSIKF